MENNHLKAENELMREELEYLRERFRKVLIEKHRPGCRELLS
jgi:cell division protein FtsB